MSTTAAVQASTFNVDDYNAKTFANTRKPSDTMDQNSFLQLMVTQLVNQDPTAPMSNNDFAQQVTSFSSLQASQTMQTDMAWIRSSSLIGSTVDVMPLNSTDKSQMKSGLVTGVRLVEGVPQIEINNDSTTTYKLSQIDNVRVAAQATPQK